MLLGYKKFDSAEVGFNQQDGYLYLNYLKESTSEDFRTLWLYVLELTDLYPHYKLLINQKKQNAFPSDQKWLVEEYAVFAKVRFPLSVEQTRYIALIPAENFYIEYTTSEYLDSSNVGGSCIQMFNNEEEALSWLLKQSN
jgi:hypothetical protein